MKITRRALLSLSLATAAVAIATGMNRPDLLSAQNQVVNLYSARHYESDKALYNSFTKKTGIKVNLIEAAGDKLIERIKSEGANSPADVIVTVDAGNLWRAQDAGLLQPVRSKILESAVPANLRDPQGYWFGFSKRARVIVYNKTKVKPSQLSTYEDLANPKWKGRIIVRSSSNVYNMSLTGSVLAKNGVKKTEEWVRGMVANFARPPEGNDTAQIKAVAAGVADLTLVNSYYVIRLMKSNKPEDKAVANKVAVFFPNQKDRGTHINIGGAGVAKASPNRAAAVKFLEHLASREAQEIFANSNNEYPAVKSASIDPILASLGKFKEDGLNAAVFGKNNAEALKIMDRGGWR